MYSHHVIVEAATALASSLPTSTVEAVAGAILTSSTSSLKAEIAKRVPHHHHRDRALSFVDCWRKEAADLDAHVVAIALQTAAVSEQKHRDSQTVELVWTGPDGGSVPFRRTEQAILQLLDSAHDRITLVSFAVYSIPNIAKALVKAAKRGVKLTVIVETPDKLGGENEYSTLRALGSEVEACSSVYYWPKENGGNVEAVLLIRNSWPTVEKLFDTQLRKRPLDLDDFEPGDESPPEDDDWSPADISVSSAVLDEKGRIQITFQHKFDEPPDSLRLALRTPGEAYPRVSVSMPKCSHTKVVVSLPDSALADAHGTLLATVLAGVGGKQFESLPVWVIQESRLTCEGGEGSSSSRSRIKETGEGLPEYLDEIGSRDGVAAMVERLRRLNIRFFDGGGGGSGGSKKVRVRISDPFESDKIPEWLIQAKGEADDLGEAVLDFVDRHDKYKLRKHADRGNINGMGNFIDILTTLIRLLYVYYKRGLIHRLKVVGRLCDWCELATCGSEGEEGSFYGYLHSLWDNLGGDEALLQNVCDNHAFCAELKAMLLIAQKLRYVPGEIPKYDKPPQSQKDVLKRQAKLVADEIAECGLEQPSEHEVREALERYQIFSPDEISEMLAALWRGNQFGIMSDFNLYIERRRMDDAGRADRVAGGVLLTLGSLHRVRPALRQRETLDDPQVPLALPLLVEVAGKPARASR